MLSRRRCCCGGPAWIPCWSNSCSPPDSDLILTLYPVTTSGGVRTRGAAVVSAATFAKLATPYDVKTFNLAATHTGLTTYWYLETSGGGFNWRFFFGCPNDKAPVSRYDAGTRFQMAATTSGSWSGFAAQPGGLISGGVGETVCSPFRLWMSHRAVPPDELTFAWAQSSWDIVIEAP